MPILLYKKIGQTPLQVIDEFRLIHPEYNNIALGFAGRLDPMAEGKLLILIGDENKERKRYELLDKTYEFEVLVGISTDTYDVMGKITKFEPVKNNQYLENISLFCIKYTGTFEQKYPPYSSKPVSGKPLYWWAREGKLSEINIPTKMVTIMSFSLQKQSVINGKHIIPTVTEKIQKTKGEFRQKDIIALWNRYETDISIVNFPVMSFKIVCSSGTYVRGIVNSFSEYVNTPMLAWSIKRTDFTLPL